MSDPLRVAPGIWSLSIATPWGAGPVNLYLLDDDPLTLVDTGWRSAVALAELEAGLAALGRRVEDLDRIVLTHQHIDHSGLASTLEARSGAEICALEPLARWMAEYPSSVDAENAFAEETLRRHGAGGTDALNGEHRTDPALGGGGAVTRVLHDGDVLAFARRRLRVLHRPGHSPYDTVLHDEETGILLGGDHLLRWPSTPILWPPGDGAARNGRPRAFAQYLVSLRSTDALELDTILPGHGEPLRDHHAAIADRLSRYEHAGERTAAAVSATPRTAATIGAELKGQFAEPMAFFVLCDVLGHLDELIDAGTVEERSGPDGVSRFVTA